MIDVEAGRANNIVVIQRFLSVLINVVHAPGFYDFDVVLSIL